MSKKSNRFFTDKNLEVLLEPKQWSIVSSLFPIEVPAIEDKLHQHWLAANCDSHSNREILICLGGNCIVSHRNMLYHCKPGTILLFGRNEMHDSFYPPTTSGVNHLWLSLVKGSVIPSLISVSNGCYSRVNSEREPVLHTSNAVNLLNSTWNALQDNPENREPAKLKCQKMVAALAAVLLELVSTGYHLPEDVSDCKKHQKQVIELIKAHIVETGGSGANLEQLAHTAGYSKFHFLRMFKRHTGCTVHSFINQQRIIVTRELLNSGYRKNEIADQLGFSSPAVFSRWYNQQGSKIREIK